LTDPAGEGDPGYAEGLRTSVFTAVAYGLDALGDELPEEHVVPTVLLAQARRAARLGINLDTVLRRYFAGYALLSQYIVEEAASGSPLGEAELQQALRAETCLFDHLVAAITAEYKRERRQLYRTSDHHLAERVRKLLMEDPIEPIDIGYELAGWHLGAVVSGPGAARTVAALASLLDRRRLAITPDGEAIWAWFGGRSNLDAQRLRTLGEDVVPEGNLVVLGEPAHGIEGWRWTHRQAKAALPIAQRGRARLVRYGDVALAAAVVNDDLLSGSLMDIYLAPLACERDAGAALRRTLSAYFAAGRSVSSAAAALGVSRQTVSSHLRRIEDRVGRGINECGTELEIALSLHSLSSSVSPDLAAGQLEASGPRA
jgi:hypothetical protein